MPVPTTKKVIFNEAINKQGQSVYNAEEARSSWLRMADFRRLSYETHRASLSIQFKQPRDNKKSYGSVLTQVYASCMTGKLPSKQAFQLYVQWCRVCPERRGIERYCVRHMASALKARISDANVLVLALQTQMALEKVPLSQRADKIREAYKEQVQPARVLARIQGIADATSIKEEAVSSPVIKSGCKRSVSETFQSVESPTMEKARLPVKKRKFFNQNRVETASPWKGAPLPSLLPQSQVHVQ